jgi:hypothetical protein
VTIRGSYGFGIKPQARPLGSNSLHEAFSVTSCRKACCCSPGRNLKNRDIDCSSAVGSSLSRFVVPAEWRGREARADFEKCSKLASRYRSRVASSGRPVHVASELMLLKCSSQHERCSPSWQAEHKVIKFKSSSEPCRLRSCLWWTCKFRLEPQIWHCQPSRRSTCFLSWSYGSGSSRARGCLGEIRFTKPSRSLRAGKPAVVRPEEI